MRLHHVQVCCPAGGEDGARRFYAEGLGMTEVAKPPGLAGRGGAWFRTYDGEAVAAELHVGVEEPFAPARKAHPAFLVEDLGAVVSGSGASDSRWTNASATPFRGTPVPMPATPPATGWNCWNHISPRCLRFPTVPCETTVDHTKLRVVNARIVWGVARVYDEELAERIRTALADRPGVREQKMFGGLSFLVDGALAVAASGDGALLVRVDPDRVEELVARPGAAIAMMRGRAMSRGWITVAPAAVAADSDLRAWVDAALARRRG